MKSKVTNLVEYGVARIGVLNEAKDLFRDRGRKVEERSYGLKLQS